jgi:predicted aminopeptidase
VARITSLGLPKHLERLVRMQNPLEQLRTVLASAERARRAANGTLSFPDLSFPP